MLRLSTFTALSLQDPYRVYRLKYTKETSINQLFYVCQDCGYIGTKWAPINGSGVQAHLWALRRSSTTILTTVEGTYHVTNERSQQ